MVYHRLTTVLPLLAEEVDVETRHITSGCTVLIAAFDDIPEHSFLVHEVHSDCITGIAQSGSLTGEYGEPGLTLVVRVISTPS